MSQYKKIRFIGYAIPTTPADLVSIGDPSGPGSVAGTNLGNADVETDITSRIAIMKNAVDTARTALPEDEDDVINLFVAPEFFFHGIHGPYVFEDASLDPVNTLRERLLETFQDYTGWTFILGSAITTQIKNPEVLLNSNSATVRNSIVRNLSENWQASFGPLKDVIFDQLINFIKICHSYPNCEVRNRSIIVSNIPIRPPETDDPTYLMTTEKYYVSNEDFLLYSVNDVPTVTEQMVAYEPIDISAGDAKLSPFDKYAILRQNDIDPDNPIATTVTDYGIEICLDHSDLRLRRNINNEPAVIGGIHVQLIPSCGMQIVLEGVATDANGFVFNCDGQYMLNDERSGQGIINDVNCLYVNHSSSTDSGYASHSQLARVTTPAQKGDPNASGATNATFETLNPDNIDIVTVANPNSVNLDEYFAGGPGEIHIYGLTDPFTLYP